jgi:glutamyl-tRNA reductase
MKTEYKTFPANLILKEKKCLIVGAGKIAMRKLGHLMRARAEITVIAPEISAKITETANTAEIKLIEKKYDETCLDGFFLVFAATNDKKLNAKIIKDCSKRKIFVCAVDENWRHGNFITPASVEKNGVTLSVSTDGTACRRTRMIRDYLSRHIEFTEETDLLIIGTDHNYLNLDEREPFHLSGEKFDNAGEMLRNVTGIHEFILLNTCNRVELAAFVSYSESLEKLILKIIGFENLNQESYYIKKGFDAFAHFAFACSGLLSQTPGEKHITAQIKSSFDYCKDKSWAGTLMRNWLDNTLHISKHIRQIIEPLFTVLEIEDISMKYMESHLRNIQTKNIMIIGTGIIGKAIADKIIASNRKFTWCYHITPPEIATEYKELIKMCPLNEIKDHIGKADVIITASNSPAYIVHNGHAPFIEQIKDIIVIDLGIPRNVSPEFGKLLPNVKIVNLDDLKHWYKHRKIDMPRLFRISTEIVEKHRDIYDKITYSTDATGGTDEE